MKPTNPWLTEGEVGAITLCRASPRAAARLGLSAAAAIAGRLA